MTFDEMPFSLYPVGDQGPRQRGLSPSDFPEGNAEHGRLLQRGPQRVRLLLLLPTASKHAGRVQGAARVSARTQAAEGEARGGAYLTRKSSELGAAPPRSCAPSAQRTCRNWAAAPTAPRPRPGPAQGPAPCRGGAHASRLPHGLGANVLARGGRRFQLVTVASP